MHLKTHASVFTTNKVLTHDNEEIGIAVTHSLTHALSFCLYMMGVVREKGG
jgi:ABC-type cobalamin/Fe3+-siderophores transport system ATPase subunit